MLLWSELYRHSIMPRFYRWFFYACCDVYHIVTSAVVVATAVAVRTWWNWLLVSLTGTWNETSLRSWRSWNDERSELLPNSFVCWSEHHLAFVLFIFISRSVSISALRYYAELYVRWHRSLSLEERLGDQRVPPFLLVRSTPPSRPNKAGLKCPSVHKKFLRFQWNLVCR